MNNPRAHCHHLDITLDVIATQDRALRQQRQQHRVALSPISVQRYQGRHQRYVPVAPATMPSRWSRHLATPLERLRGKHLIRFYNSGQPGGLVVQEPVSPAKRGFQVDATGLGRLPQRETLTEIVGIVSSLVLVVQPSQGVV